ncbi:MAG: SMC-Scp complex subunit ScpB [Lachnospiraceae bacterium]|nr:SMC-Scp complex subunit ScpB [Lachnospiraceae bacterium]
MNSKELQSVIEGILFTTGAAIEIDRLAEVSGQERIDVEFAIEALKERYALPESGITVLTIDDKVQLCTKTELYEYLIKIAKAPKDYTLTDTVLETLSIIAYKQPVTKMQIENIRGVSCDHAVNKLVEYDLVRELGRLDAPGHPILFGTTEEFLRAFGVGSIEELPELNIDKVESFREQAEEEADEQLGRDKTEEDDEKINVDI